MEKINLFISYAHEDKEHLPELFTYLNETTCPQIDIWHDDRISLGQGWNDEIQSNLNRADIVLLLVSQQFLMSHYIRDNELVTAFQRHDKEEATVIPIFFRYCNLEKYPKILNLQGYPNKDEPLMETPVKKDRYYSVIQEKINSIASKIIINKNISLSLAQEKMDSLSDNAKEIEQLKTLKKIFLSIPTSEEGHELRKNFIITIEGKIKYDMPKWPYEVVPGIPNAREIYKSDSAHQKLRFAELLNECLYSIHFLGSAADLKNNLFLSQYNQAKESKSLSTNIRTILWFLNANIKEELESLDEAFKVELKMLPIVIGTDYKAIFTLIEGFDAAKEKQISKLSSSFSPIKKIFMFYDFEKDNDSELRIRLRKKIQEDKKFAIRDLADESFENQKKGIEECNGAIIFYGSNCDSIWYKMRERIILKAGNIMKGAVCVDGKEEPEIEKRVDRDVSVTEILSIKGEKELETGVINFKNILQEDNK